MMDKREMGLLMGVIGRLSSENALNKAFNTVLIKELAKLTGSRHEELLKSVDSLQAQYVLESQKVFSELLEEAFGDDKPPYIEDFLK